MKQAFWPDNISRKYGTDEKNVLVEKIYSAKKLVGVVSDISREGAEILREAFVFSEIAGNERPEWRLLFGVNPARATQEEGLSDLLDFQEYSEGAASFRLLLPVAVQEKNIAMNVIFGVTADGQCFLSLGSLSSLGVGNDSAATANLLIERPEPLLVDQCRKFFDYQWELGVELNDASARIPYLIPAKGDPEAAMAWDKYQQMCLSLQSLTENGGESAAVDIETGEVIKFEGEKLSELLKLPQVDLLEQRVAELYSKGQAVTLEHKNKPLQAPLSASALGINSVREDAGVTLRVNFQVDLFDDDTQKKVNRLRDKVRENINLFGFKLADGYTWIPDTVRAQLDERISNLEKEVGKQLSGLLKGDVDAFLNSRRTNIKASCERFAKEMAPGIPLRDESVDKVIAVLRQRATQAIEGNYLPRTTFSNISFDPITRAAHEDGWAQATKLISDIAGKPRDAIVGEYYFVRNLKPDLDMSSYFQLMNVLNDHIVQLFAEDYREAKRVAEVEQKLVKEIKENDLLDGKSKCRIYLSIIQGKFASPDHYFGEREFRRALLDISWILFDRDEANSITWQKLMNDRLGSTYLDIVPELWNILKKWPQDIKFDSGIAVEDLK